MNQVNNVIKTLFSGSSEKELHEIFDTFWSKYKKFNHKNDPFEINEFIWSSKDILDVNVICGIRNTIYHQPKSLVV